MKKIISSPRRDLVTAALAVAALLSLLPAGTAQAGQPHQRDGWQVGMSYGYGRGRVKPTGDDTQYDFRGGATPQIRFGHMVSGHLALQVEYGAWMFEDGILPHKARVSMQDVVLAATWYPGDRDGWTGGFYLRGGAGLGWASFALIEVNDEQEQVNSERLDESGLGLQAALGYEWRFVRSAAAGIGVSVQHLSIDGDLYKETTFAPVTFSLAWYWD